MGNKKKGIIGLMFVCLAFITCCMFPFLNLTKVLPIKMEMINWLIILVSIMFYINMGKFEEKMFPSGSIMPIVLFNLIATIVGMGMRFLIEFGEISNIYNFTLPNIVLHTLVSVVMTSGTWFFCEKPANKI